MCPRFDEYVAMWSCQARLNVSEGWKLCQDQVIRDHILPHLFSKSLNEITPSDISAILNASRDRGHASNTQRKIYNVLSKLFSDAIHFFELIEKNPVRKKFHRPRVRSIERASLSPDQCTIFLEYVMNHELFGIACWIQVLSGIRVSEVQALEWSDFDWEKDTININRAYNKHTKEIQNYTKNKDFYRVPISPRLRELLFKRRKKKGLVCINQVGKMLSSKAYDDYIKRVSKTLYLSITSSHGLRHSCARLYASHGASDEDLQKLLGHKHLSSTKTYIHRTDESLFLISKKIS